MPGNGHSLHAEVLEHLVDNPLVDVPFAPDVSEDHRIGPVGNVQTGKGRHRPRHQRSILHSMPFHRHLELVLKTGDEREDLLIGSRAHPLPEFEVLPVSKVPVVALPGNVRHVLHMEEPVYLGMQQPLLVAVHLVDGIHVQPFHLVLILRMLLHLTERMKHHRHRHVVHNTEHHLHMTGSPAQLVAQLLSSPLPRSNNLHHTYSSSIFL